MSKLWTNCEQIVNWVLQVRAGFGAVRGFLSGEGSGSGRAGAAGLRRTGAPSKRAGELRADELATHSKRAINLDRVAPGNIWIIYQVVPTWVDRAILLKIFTKFFVKFFNFWFLARNFFVKNFNKIFCELGAVELRSHGSPLNTGELASYRDRGGAFC